MLANEFDEIKRILNGRYKVCDDGTDVIRWYESLKGFDFATVKEAINDWIINDGWKPEVVNIVERCKDIERWNKQVRAAEEPNVKTIACPYCRDSGLIVKISPTGIVQGEPCDYCSRGKKNFPWKYLSEQEKHDYNTKEIKAGRSVPKVHVAPDDFRAWYVYGKETSK